MQKVGKSKPRFLIQKNHQFIFAALFEFLMSQIFHRKKLDDFSAANMTKIKTNVKKGEDGLVEQRSFVGWKYGPCREKKLKIALLNETDFKVKFKFKVENCVLQISVHPFLGWNIWQNSTRPFFSYILQWNWKGKSKYVHFGLDKSIWNIWVQLKWGKRMKFPSEIFGCE